MRRQGARLGVLEFRRFHIPVPRRCQSISMLVFQEKTSLRLSETRSNRGWKPFQNSHSLDYMEPSTTAFRLPCGSAVGFRGWTMHSSALILYDSLLALVRRWCSAIRPGCGVQDMSIIRNHSTHFYLHKPVVSAHKSRCSHQGRFDVSSRKVHPSGFSSTRSIHHTSAFRQLQLTI